MPISAESDFKCNVYKKEIAKNDCLPEHQPVLKPKNVKQISNVQAKNRQKYRLIHDALLWFNFDGC